MRIFSGIQPTGRKHLGNYIGAVRGWVEGQDRGEPAIYCMVDLHAVTVPYEPAELRRYVYDTTALLMASGLDPERCVLFRQSDVHEHTELTWLLSSVTAHGDLNRMTQFKEKSAQQRELVSAGLFLYPMLQAADVLVYRAHEVPVGEDQRQHIELMRDVAMRFNATYGETLVVPEHRIPEVGARIMDLQDPTSKMSTTASEEKGLIYIDDEEKRILKKIKSAVTDSGGDVRRGPGQGGHHQPDRHPGCGPRRRPCGHRGRVRGPAVRRLQGRGGRGGRGLPAPGARALRTSCAPTRRRSRRRWTAAPTRRASWPPRRWWTCAPRWASASPKR